MPRCENCGSFVPEGYVRVFTPGGGDPPRICPSCEDAAPDDATGDSAGSTPRE